MAAGPPADIRPELAHPLCGADLGTLVRALLGNGGVARNRLPQALIALLATLARTPFSLAERLAVPMLARRRGPMPAPVFIVGHWRSGTTHLYNVMSRDPRLGFVPPIATGLPWDFLGLGALLRPLLERALPEHRWVDAIPVTPDAPQEDEIALANMTTLSFYHGLYFPKHLQRHLARGLFFDDCSELEVERWSRRHVHFLTKLHVHQGGRRLLVKNPVYTARIALLRRIWPDAKFVHIHRNPFLVFPSMRNFYARLLEAFALQDAGEGAGDALILETYARMMASLEEQRQELPAGAWIELGLEEFEAAPLAMLERIYDGLDLPGYADALPHFETALRRESDYPKRPWALPAEDALLVERHARPVLERYGYDRPPA